MSPLELQAYRRRQLLKSSACGFGYLALRSMCHQELQASEAGGVGTGVPHRPARAKRVIFLFMHGGPSHVDTFDYKPELQKRDGERIPITNLPPNIETSTANGKLLMSPWKTKQYGECGQYVSELFPHVAEHVDDICFLKGMHTEGQSHAQAVSMIHTGDTTFVRPSMGAWITYGLASENKNIPGFVTICPTRDHGGVRNYGSAFLPAFAQGTPYGMAGTPASKATVSFLENSRLSPQAQEKQLAYIQEINRQHLDRVQYDPAIEGVIKSYEMAFSMQQAFPEIMDIKGETPETLSLYGINEKGTDDFGRQCLLARRLAEAGVRCIQVTHRGNNAWDQHGGLKAKHEVNCQETDKPVAGLLSDLKRRGLLEDTLVLWGGEFGRTPVAQGKDGRDHNPQGFTVWMAGGGVKPGFSYGSTDDFGYYASENKTHVHDLHATILALMGMEHTSLTYRYAGRDFRLTDVYGRVVEEIMA